MAFLREPRDGGGLILRTARIGPAPLHFECDDRSRQYENDNRERYDDHWLESRAKHKARNCPHDEGGKPRSAKNPTAPRRPRIVAKDKQPQEAGGRADSEDRGNGSGNQADQRAS